MKNICMAHRGWSGRAPENTMAAFRMAFNEPRIKAIELDVQLSADRVPVVIHDFTLNRTTNGSGLVGKHTYEELAKLDAGGWFHPSFAGEKIPKLEEVLQAAKGKCKLNLELKTAGELYPGIQKIVGDMVRAYRMESEVCVTSFDHDVIRKMKDIYTNIQTGLIFAGRPLLIENQLREAGASMISIDYMFLTPSFVSRMIQQGYSIIAWTVNDPLAIRKVMQLHPDIQICTNYPERMFPLMSV